MHAEFRLLIGIVIAHAMWALAYATGTLVDGRAARPQTRSQALLDFVVRTASGIALWGFGAFALGLAGWLNAWAVAALLPLFCALGALRFGRAFFGAAFWRDHAARVGLAFGGGNLALYYVALATIVPAALPSNESDAMRYHLAYAMDWANHGNLFIDRFLRQPLYANNYLLIFAIFDVLHLEAFVAFAAWVPGALAVLAVRAALTALDDAGPPPAGPLARWSRRAVTLLLPLTIVISPVFLRWEDAAYVDIPIELYVFVPALCALAAVLTRRDLRWTAVVCAAFAIGMKISLIAFVPLFALTIWFAIRTAGGTRRAAALACAVMVLAGSPWYVRNVIYDGDPIPPLVNLALHRPDLTYSAEDARGVLQDIKPDRSADALLALPYRIWADPLYSSLREYGSVALNLLLYLPVFVACAILAFGTRSPRGKVLLLLSATAVYTLAYCLMTSYLLRYLLITQVPLAATVGALLLMIPGVRFAAQARVAIAALTLVPSPSAFSYYDFRWQAYYRGFEARFPSDDAYLTATVAGYPETQRILELPQFKRKDAPRVLLIHVQTEYYFRLGGVQTVGDWFGPGRFEDLRVAIENGRLPDYLRYFDVGAVLMERHGDAAFTRGQIDGLVAGLRAEHFRILENDPNGFLLAVR